MSKDTKPEANKKLAGELAATPETIEGSRNFIEEIIAQDLSSGRLAESGKIMTRFPPEPNGYLHIGHAKSILLNFGLAETFPGVTNLRFDDTNPSTEDTEYVDAIKEDIRWLGVDWADREYYASDYFEQLYDFAVRLIKKGLAYVDDQAADEVVAKRGNFYKTGEESPCCVRSVEENLDLFARMRAGEFEEGSRLLRARIDMAHPNMSMRDPIMYRIRKVPHHRTGDDWVIYPMYDWAHGQSDAIEGITHSICTLEFDSHRPLYDWFLAALELPNPPRQYEFARLNLTYTVMSKRKLLELVEQKLVDGWDDPRMPTLCGMRRRGYTPEAIRDFCERIGVAKNESMVDLGLLEFAVRDDLNKTAPRGMAVLKPLKLVIENLEPGHVEWLDCPWFPDEPERGSRKVPFTRELFVEQDDFREEAPRKWHRLAPGKEVRLRYAALVTCKEAIKNDLGEIVELRCTWDPASKGGMSPDGRKVRGTLHWVSAEHAVDAEVRLYDRLFTKENPLDLAEGQDYKDLLNPGSVEKLSGCKLEPAWADLQPGERVQFERMGYYVTDAKLSKPGALVFNRTVGLRDSWAKIEKKGGGAAEGGSNKGKQKGKGGAQVINGGQKAPKQAKVLETPDTPTAPAREGLSPSKETIVYDDFAKLDLRVAVVAEAGLVEGADKLLRVLVDLGEGRLRQIFAGVREFYPDPSVLVGRQVIVVANLAPRKMRFGVSEGMILSGGGEKPGDPLAVTTFLSDLRPGDTVA